MRGAGFSSQGTYPKTMISCTIQPSRSGFTFMEVMVALAIISIVFTTVFRLHSQTLSMNLATSFYTDASLVAEKMMTQAEAELATPGAQGIPTNQNIRTIKGYPGYTCRITYEKTQIPDMDTENKDFLAEIELTVQHSESEQKYHIKTHRLIPETD